MVHLPLKALFINSKLFIVKIYVFSCRHSVRYSTRAIIHIFLSAFWSTVRKLKHASSAAERNEAASHSSHQSSNASDLKITYPIIYSKTTYLLYLNWFIEQLHIIDNRKIVLENNYRFPMSQLFGLWDVYVYQWCQRLHGLHM